MNRSRKWLKLNEPAEGGSRVVSRSNRNKGLSMNRRVKWWGRRCVAGSAPFRRGT